MASLLIGDIEKCEKGVIYWVDEGDKKRVFGVVFPNGIHNIANQGVAESITLSLAVTSDMVEQL